MFKLSDELIQRILDKYGEDEQLRQTMGECGELIAACQNYHRAQEYGHREETLEDVMEEAVDVYFMIQQIRSLDEQLFEQLCEVKRIKVMSKLFNENK